MKLNILTIIFDVSSFICGVVGIALGIYSLLALNPSWNNPTISYKLTVIAIIFDIFSCLFALLAFRYGYNHFMKKKENLSDVKNLYQAKNKDNTTDFMNFSTNFSVFVSDIFAYLLFLFMYLFGYNFFMRKKEKFNKFKKNSHSLEVKAIMLDFMSFCLGIIGLLCEALSLLALLPKWNNVQLSYNITVAAVIFDIFSVLLIIIALVITVIANHKLKNGNLSIVK